jgi:hypothetical protein
MSLSLNGTGHLVYPNKIVSGFPFSMAIWVASGYPNSNQAAIMQGQSDGDRYAMGWFTGYDVSKNASLRNPASSQSAVKSTAPNLSAGTQRLLIVVFESTTSRRVYFGSNVPETNSTAMVDDVVNHNQVMIGAYQSNGGSVLYPLTGNIAEAHFFDRALTAADYDTMVGGTLPESMTNWVDGWTLQTYSAGGTYTSIGGGRTLTANGGVAAGTLTHPITRAGGGDTTAPVLSSPAGSSTGPSSASISVITDEGAGVLYSILAITSTPPSSVQIQAGQTNSGATAPWSGNTAVGSTGSKSFTPTGLGASTTYYAHFQQIDSSGNNSSVVTSAAFTTSASGDSTAPTLSNPTGTKTGASTATGTVSTNEANGTLYRFATVNATETAATVKAANLTSAVTTTGVQNVSFTGLTQNTQYYAHYVHRDAAGNDSARVSSAAFTTDAVSVGRITTPPIKNNTGTVLANISGWTAYVYNATTRALVTTVTGLTTSATGVLTIDHASIVTGTNYRYDVDHATYGCRLPNASAT